MTRAADFKSLVRARAHRRGTSYTQARRETLALRARTAAQTGAQTAVLHVTNGDSVVPTLRTAAGAGEIPPGEILPWRDVLHEGPVPAGLSPAALRRERAQFLAHFGEFTFAKILASLEARDAQLIHGQAAYVLWFEADLYDQLQLVQVLDLLTSTGVAPEQITLVSAGEFPGIAHFGGLGELEADELSTLFEQRVTLRPETLTLAQTAWHAFRAPDPTALVALSRTHSRELRFLGEAVGRLLQEYPWCADGLSLTQRRILEALETQPASVGAVFRTLGERERRPYLGDSIAFDYMRALARGQSPLLHVAGPDGHTGPDGSEDTFVRATLSLTDDGRRVLDGEADHGLLNGIDRWIGGVHLTGQGQWRYDERRETLVAWSRSA